MNVEKQIRIYLVDDHPVVRAGLKAMFADYPQIQVAGEASNAATSLHEIPALQPDVVLLDLRLPDTDGFILCQKLKSLPQPPRVMFLTSYGEEDNILAALGSGADGYMLKESRDDVLVSAITMVASGGTVWPSLITRSFREHLHSASDPIQIKLHLLSPQEQRVLALVAEGKTNKEIGGLLGVSEKTIRNQISSLMKKLAVERRAQAAAYYVRFSPKPPLEPERGP